MELLLGGLWGFLNFYDLLAGNRKGGLLVDDDAVVSNLFEGVRKNASLLLLPGAYSHREGFGCWVYHLVRPVWCISRWGRLSQYFDLILAVIGHLSRHRHFITGCYCNST